MTGVITSPVKKPYRLIVSTILVVFVALLPLILSGCGSTRVYTTQKSVTYNGNLYNVSNVKVMSSSIAARLSDGIVLDMKNANKKTFNDYVAIYGPLPVWMVIALDDQELVYYASTTKSFSDFDKARSAFVKAQKSMGKFMADKKATQLKLK